MLIKQRNSTFYYLRFKQKMTANKLRGGLVLDGVDDDIWQRFPLVLRHFHGYTLGQVALDVLQIGLESALSQT